MKKSIIIPLAAVLCLSLLAGCNLSEADLTGSNIKTVLSEKADELENSLSTAKMKLSCEVESVEVHNAGEEIVNN